MDEKETVKKDTVVIFSTTDESEQGGKVCSILEVDSVEEGRIITKNAKYVLPLSDASIYNSDEGIVYAYSVNLPYLKEIEHLAEVEKNIVISQLFNYPNRHEKKSNVPLIIGMAMVFILFIIALIS